MRNSFAYKVVEALALGAATAAGVYLMHALRDPYSDVRLYVVDPVSQRIRKVIGR